MATSVMSSNDVIQRVLAKYKFIPPALMRTRVETNIIFCIYGAQERLGRAIKDSTDRHKLQKKITKAPVAGVIDLTHADFNSIFIDTFKLPGSIRTSAENAMTFKHFPSIDAMRAKTPTDIVAYHLFGRELVFKNPTDQALNTYTTSLSLLGSFVPSLWDAAFPLDDTLDDQLVSRVTEMIGQLGGLEFLKMDKDLAEAAVAAMQE